MVMCVWVDVSDVRRKNCPSGFGVEILNFFFWRRESSVRIKCGGTHRAPNLDPTASPSPRRLNRFKSPPFSRFDCVEHEGGISGRSRPSRAWIDRSVFLMTI